MTTTSTTSRGCSWCVTPSSASSGFSRCTPRRWLRCGATCIWGARLRYVNVSQTFTKLARRAGLAARPGACRPRPHDLRHSFAVTSLLDWYRDGGDVAARLPLLSAYLGHVEPAGTYWYLHAAPELLAEAARRLRPGPGARQ